MDGSAIGVPIAARPSELPRMALSSYETKDDPAEAVAKVASARRERMLRIHRRWLRREDLEDCYSQATLELVARSRRAPFASNDHLTNALEQKFLSRIEDKRRAMGGRSSIEAALARSVPVDGPENGRGDIEDRRAAVEEQVIARTELRTLREVIADLSRDQQLVLASQVCVDMGVSEFCARYGWSVEKYRKVAQRARTKLRVLVDEYERGERCRRLEADVIAMSAGTAEGVELDRAKAHIANCRACARMAGELDRAAHSIAAVLPLPAVLIGGSVWSKLAALVSGGRRAAAILRHPLAETGYSSVGATGGSLASLGALKVGMAVVCVAGAAGSYAVCAHLGVVPSLGLTQHAHRVALRQKPSRSTVHQRDVTSRARSGLRNETVTSQTPAPEVAATRTGTVARSVTHQTHRRVSAVAQIRREFATPPAHAAAAPSPGTLPSTTQPASPQAAPPPTTGQTRQTQAEFGFER